MKKLVNIIMTILIATCLMLSVPATTYADTPRTPIKCTPAGCEQCDISGGNCYPVPRPKEKKKEEPKP